MANNGERSACLKNARKNHKDSVVAENIKTVRVMHKKKNTNQKWNIKYKNTKYENMRIYVSTSIVKSENMKIWEYMCLLPKYENICVYFQNMRIYVSTSIVKSENMKIWEYMCLLPKYENICVYF